MTEERCIFCEIIAGAIPAAVVYEDEESIAFLDITPINQGHVLVVPKHHSRNIFDARHETLAPLMRSVQKIAHAVRAGTGAEGINIHMNNESAAGQAVFHTHIHIIPRFHEDGIIMWKGHPYSDGEMQKLATQIKTALL
ncbi:MAG: HIT family protein [Patescibacteria group bacterium]